MIRASLALLVLTLACAAGCTNDVAPAEETRDPADARNLDADLREGCRSPRRYDAHTTSGTCTNIASPNGAWEAKPLASDAPQGLCTYAFRSKDGTSRAPSQEDADALKSRATVAPNCTHSSPAFVTLEPIEYFIPPMWGGAMGCDVCGARSLTARKAWILLPPDSVTERFIEARLVSGEKRAFALINVPKGASAVRIELPAPPPGDAWVQGNISAR